MTFAFAIILIDYCQPRTSPSLSTIHFIMSHPSSSASILEAPSKSVKLRTPKKLALSSFTRRVLVLLLRTSRLLTLYTSCQTEHWHSQENQRCCLAWFVDVCLAQRMSLQYWFGTPAHQAVTVTYSDKFYQAALSPELEDYCKIGKLNGIAAFRHELRLGSTAVVKGFYKSVLQLCSCCFVLQLIKSARMSQ